MDYKIPKVKLTIDKSNSFDSSDGETFLPSDSSDEFPVKLRHRHQQSRLIRAASESDTVVDSAPKTLKTKRPASDNLMRKISFGPETILHSAASESDNQELWKVLCDHPLISVDQPMYNGMTALHQCICNRNLDGVKILLCFQADPNIADQHGFTPLHTAAAHGFIDIASLLIVHQANIFAQNSDGEMAVDVAADSRTSRLLYDEMLAQCHAQLAIESWIEYHFWDFLSRLRKRITIIGNETVSWIGFLYKWFTLKETEASSQALHSSSKAVRSSFT